MLQKIRVRALPLTHGIAWSLFRTFPVCLPRSGVSEKRCRKITYNGVYTECQSTFLILRNVKDQVSKQTPVLPVPTTVIGVAHEENRFKPKAFQLIYLLENHFSSADKSFDVKICQVAETTHAHISI